MPRNNGHSKQRTALVTGATSGIGRVIAKRLCEEGYRVFGTGRTVEIGGFSDGIHWIPLILENEQSVIAAIDYLEQQVEGLDVLVNNAGRGMIGPVETSSDTEVRELFDANVFGLLHVCRRTIKLLRERPGAKMINISSIAGSIGLPFRGIYSASKFALEGLSEALRTELKPFDVHVSLIQPGDVKTNIKTRRVMASNVAGTVYESRMRQIVQQIDDEVENAIPPERVAEVVVKILRSKRPLFRYRVGSFIQRASIALKRFLPYKWFEAMLEKFYNEK